MVVTVEPFDFKPIAEAIKKPNTAMPFDSFDQEVGADKIEINYTAEQLKESEEEGYQRGIIDGMNQGRKDIYDMNQKVLDTVNNIIPQMQQLLAAHQLKVDNSVAETSKLSLEVAKKIAGDALYENPMPMIQKTIAQCLTFIFNEPKVTIIVHESLVETFREQMASISVEFDGELQIAGSEQIAVGDCKIQWQDGGAEVSSAQRISQIQEVINAMETK